MRARAMPQYVAQFTMLFSRESGRHIDTNDRKEALKVCYFLRITHSISGTLNWILAGSIVKP
jgi:hypothetical protein